MRVCSQLPSLVRRRKVSPSRQSSARGNNLLANGSGWQHQSSTMAFQLPFGRGRTRLNNLKKRQTYRFSGGKYSAAGKYSNPLTFSTFCDVKALLQDRLNSHTISYNDKVREKKWRGMNTFRMNCIARGRGSQSCIYCNFLHVIAGQRKLQATGNKNKTTVQLNHLKVRNTIVF